MEFRDFSGIPLVFSSAFERAIGSIETGNGESAGRVGRFLFQLGCLPPKSTTMAIQAVSFCRFGGIRLSSTLSTASASLTVVICCNDRRQLDRHAAEKQPSFFPTSSSSSDEFSLACSLSRRNVLCQRGASLPALLQGRILERREDPSMFASFATDNKRSQKQQSSIYFQLLARIKPTD